MEFRNLSIFFMIDSGFQFDKGLNTPLQCSTFNVLLPELRPAIDKSNMRQFEKIFLLIGNSNYWNMDRFFLPNFISNVNLKQKSKEIVKQKANSQILALASPLDYLVICCSNCVITILKTVFSTSGWKCSLKTLKRI